MLLYSGVSSIVNSCQAVKNIFNGNHECCGQVGSTPVTPGLASVGLMEALTTFVPNDIYGKIDIKYNKISQASVATKFAAGDKLGACSKKVRADRCGDDFSAPPPIDFYRAYVHKNFETCDGGLCDMHYLEIMHAMDVVGMMATYFEGIAKGMAPTEECGAVGLTRGMTPVAHNQSQALDMSFFVDTLAWLSERSDYYDALGAGCNMLAFYVASGAMPPIPGADAYCSTSRRKLSSTTKHQHRMLAPAPAVVPPDSDVVTPRLSSPKPWLVQQRAFADFSFGNYQLLKNKTQADYDKLLAFYKKFDVEMFMSSHIHQFVPDPEGTPFGQIIDLATFTMNMTTMRGTFDTYMDYMMENECKGGLTDRWYMFGPEAETAFVWMKDYMGKAACDPVKGAALCASFNLSPTANDSVKIATVNYGMDQMYASKILSRSVNFLATESPCSLEIA